MLNVVENDKTYINTNPKCEPQLGKRGLYKAIGGQNDTQEDQMAMLWVLNLSDGKHSLLDISKRSEIKFETIKHISDTLAAHGLLEEVSQRSQP